MTKPRPFGHYFILEKIAQGGMAEIFKGLTYDFTGLKKFIVIKRILPHISANKDFIKMLIDEAKIAVRLSHGNIAQTFDLGKVADDYFIVMEFVDGRTISQIFKRSVELKQSIPIPLAAYVVSELANGLDYIHRRADETGRPLEIVHRDISPQNVILSYSGNVKIVDFGVAKAASKLSELENGVLKGKFAYMSPEQTEGLPLDHTSDLFSTGVVLWEMLTGRRLFKKKSNAETIDSVQHMTVYPPSAYRNDIPSDLDDIVMKCLERDPAKRYPNAFDVSLALTKFTLKHYPDFKTSQISDFLKELFQDDDNTGDLYQERTMREDLTIRDRLNGDKRQHEELLTPVEETMIVDPQELDFRSIFEEIDVDEVSDITRSIALKDKEPEEGGAKAAQAGEEEITGDLPLAEMPPPKASGAKNSVSLKFIGLSILIVLTGLFLLYHFFLSSSPANLTLVFDPPDATVTFDGVEQKGSSPLVLKGLNPKIRHDVIVKRDYYETSERILSVWPSSNSTQKIQLMKKKASPIKVTSSPNGAAIFINGSDTGLVTPAQLDSEKFKFPLTLGLSLGGSPQWEQPVEAPPMQPLELHGDLRKDYGILDIESSPSDVIIKINGQNVGKTPLKSLSFPAGEKNHIVFVMDGFKEFSQDFTLKVGETRRIYHALEKKPSR